MTNKKGFIQTSAFIDKGAKIGRGTKIWRNTHVTNTAIIGKNCSIGQNCYIAGKIGAGCKLQNNVNVYKGVTLKNFVFCGPSMTFTNVLNPRAEYPKKGKYIKTLVEKGASIGAGAVIVCGIKIGKWSLIGAGSVVTKDISDYAIAYGNPAEIKGSICRCGEKLPLEFDKFECKKCKAIYYKKNNLIKRK